ncbi:hypothetical protein scyTo_0018707, partial [Scyliorhinus torazame]|nr:hypothetical protein [Scyliorhinus torazame]
RRLFYFKRKVNRILELIVEDNNGCLVGNMVACPHKCTSECNKIHQHHYRCICIIKLSRIIWRSGI